VGDPVVLDRSYPQDGYAVSCLSAAGGLVTCAQGLTVQADHSFADAPPLDVLLYPGGQGTRPQLTDERQPGRVRRQRATASLLTPGRSPPSARSAPRAYSADPPEGARQLAGLRPDAGPGPGPT